MSNVENVEPPAKEYKPWQFKPGHDAKAIGAGRKPGGSTRHERKVARDKLLAAQAAAAELTASALEKMRSDIAGMDQAALAQFAGGPAVQLLLETIADETQPRALRVTAANSLLNLGWLKAPTKGLVVTASVDQLDDRQLLALGQAMFAQALPQPPATAPEGFTPLLPLKT